MRDLVKNLYFMTPICVLVLSHIKGLCSNLILNPNLVPIRKKKSLPRRTIVTQLNMLFASSMLGLFPKAFSQVYLEAQCIIFRPDNS